MACEDEWDEVMGLMSDLAMYSWEGVLGAKSFLLWESFWKNGQEYG